MVAPVFFVDVVDDLLTALVAEVNVKVGHGNALGVEEAFKNQVVADGVDVGDAHAVGGKAARARTAPGTDRDVPAFGVVDKVVDDEVVVGVPHILDDAYLIRKALAQGVGDLAGIAALQPLVAELFKVGLVLHAVGRFEVGQLGVAEGKGKITLLRNFVGVLAGFRHQREQVVHLVGAFQVELIGLKFHAVGVGNGLAGLDAQKDALHLGVVAADVVRIVGGDHRDAGFARKADELRQHDRVLLQTVVLQFQIVVPCPEQIAEIQRGLLGALVIPCQNRLRHLARQTRRQADQTLVVLFQQLLIHARLGVEPLGKTGGYHFN